MMDAAALRQRGLAVLLGSQCSQTAHESGVRGAYVGAPMTRTVLAAVSVVLLFPLTAVAEEEPGNLTVAQPLPGPSAPVPEGVVGNGGWLFADSPYVAGTLQPVAISRFSYSDHTTLDRPFGANIGSPGAAVELGGEMGLAAGFSVQAVAVRGTSPEDLSGQTGGMAGIRFSALPRDWEHWQLVLSAGWIGQLSGGQGVWSTVQAGFVTGPLRTQMSVHVEHIFATGRDAADVMVTAGAAVRLVSFFSLGVEYLGQDLEATFISAGGDAEGGARHLLGPTFAFALVDDKLSIVAGPAVSIGSSGSHLMGRLAVSYGF